MNDNVKPQVISTDLTQCYDEFGKQTDCNNTGQDGELNRGIKWPSPRFSTEENTVKDNLTGLMWPRDASLTEFPMTWKEAFDSVSLMNQENLFGFSDWRMPSRDELFSLVSHNQINPALPENHPFENVFSGYYWTKTPCARLPQQAWYIHLGGARVFKGMKHGSYMVWPVRGNQSENKTSLNPFILQNNLATDTRTGLTWTKNADIFHTPLDWKNALSYIQNLNEIRHEGCNDWRLPNIRELESLVDLTRHSPSLPENHPFAKVRNYYWSSTTSVYETAYAWTLYLTDGNVGVGYKPKAEFYAWPVRSNP